MFGLFSDKQIDELARRLAGDLGKRVAPSALAKGGERTQVATEKALDMLTDAVTTHRKANGLGLLKQIQLSKRFQAELDLLGYEDDFIREATLRLAQGFAVK